MTWTLVAALILVVAVVVWLVRPRRRPSVEPWEGWDVEAPDAAELGAAKREVRDRPSLSEPGTDRPEDDWGPGAPKRG